MEENTQPQNQILPEDIVSVDTGKNKLVNKKAFLYLGIALFVVLSGLFATNPDLFKGSLDFNLGTKRPVETKDVKIYSLFKQTYLSSSQPRNQNNLIFVVNGKLPSTTSETKPRISKPVPTTVVEATPISDSTNLTVDPSPIANSNDTVISANPPITTVESNTQPENNTVVIEAESNTLTTENRFQGFTGANVDSANIESKLSSLEPNNTNIAISLNTEENQLSGKLKSAFDTSSEKTISKQIESSVATKENTVSNATPTFNTSLLSGNIYQATNQFSANTDAIRSVFSSYKYSLEISRDQANAEKITIPIAGDALFGATTNKIVAVNVHSNLANLSAGTYIASLIAVNEESKEAFITPATKFEIVTTEAAFSRPVNLEAQYSADNGLQYRLILNNVINRPTEFRNLVESGLVSGNIVLKPTTGSEVSFPITGTALKLLQNSTNFPNSSDAKISPTDLTAKNVSGQYSVTSNLQFRFTSNTRPIAANTIANVATVNALTNNVQVNFVAPQTPPAQDPALEDDPEDNTEGDPEEPPVTPPADNQNTNTALTCSDRLLARAISVNPATHNFGEVLRNETSKIDIVVAKSTGETFTDLRFTIEDDSNAISARIGDRALVESIRSNNGLLPIATNLTINVQFKPTRATSYTNRISIYDPRVPSTCDPIAVIELRGQGVNPPQETSDDPDEGIAYINDQRQIEPSFNPGAAYLNYYQSSYDYVPSSLPEIAEPNHSGVTSGGSSGSGYVAASNSSGQMPIAETGPGLLFYPALMAASAIIARRFKK